jgi:catechol 2,3-dioxygenase-like lactoylglutathione lyase family enzyme
MPPETRPAQSDEDPAVRARLATINLQVASPERSKRFYVDVLGMAEDAERSHPPSFVYLRTEGCDVTLATPPESSGAEPSCTIELGFEVGDIAAMRAQLSAQKVRNLREESMGWGQAIELRDPDGHRVLVYSFERPDEPGGR